MWPRGLYTHSEHKDGQSMMHMLWYYTKSAKKRKKLDFRGAHWRRPHSRIERRHVQINRERYLTKPGHNMNICAENPQKVILCSNFWLWFMLFPSKYDEKCSSKYIFTFHFYATCKKSFTINTGFGTNKIYEWAPGDLNCYCPSSGSQYQRLSQ